VVKQRRMGMAVCPAEGCRRRIIYLVSLLFGIAFVVGFASQATSESKLGEKKVGKL
jgi:hypothetical protein